MKTYEEMAESALTRIRQARTRKKKQVKILWQTAACVCCVVLAAGCLWQFRPTQTITPAPATQSAVTLPVPTEIQAQPTELAPTLPEDRLVINRVSADNTALDVASTAMETQSAAPLAADYVPMDDGQLRDYYGIDILPTVPEDLTPDGGTLRGSRGIYRREQGQGEVYYDAYTLSYTGENDRRLTVALSKCTPLDDTPEGQPSVIAGQAVVITLDGDGLYTARAELGDTHLECWFRGMTEDEITAVLRSILEQEGRT